jgi:hypothetical protein
MKIIFYRHDQYNHFLQAAQEGGLKTIHMENYHYRSRNEGTAADVREIVQAATDMMEGGAFIRYAVLTDDNQLIDAF